MSKEMIKKAIRERKLINIVHENNGKPATYRNLAPFNIGTSKAGNEVLRAYQTGGQTNDAPSPGWALYRIDKMVVEITNKSFDENDSKFSQYKSTDKGLRSIEISVAKTSKPDATAKGLKGSVNKKFGKVKKKKRRRKFN